VIRPHAEGAVRVQLRVGQAVTCRVCGIRDADIQIRCGGVNAGYPQAFSSRGCTAPILLDDEME
ncbi:hypothetical protein LAY04_24745, partial [Escherichia coli]|nr:hypothetical protein [Escherichia coli]